MDTLSVKLPHEVNEALGRLAASRGVPKSQLIREACSGYVASHPALPTVMAA